MKNTLTAAVIILLCASSAFVACAPAEGIDNVKAGASRELILHIDSTHHVICYHIENFREGGPSCIALDSAHWYPRVERAP